MFWVISAKVSGSILSFSHLALALALSVLRGYTDQNCSKGIYIWFLGFLVPGLVGFCCRSAPTEFNTCSSPVEFCLIASFLFAFLASAFLRLASAEALPALPFAVSAC